MAPKRYSIYASDALDAALAGRYQPGDESGLRSRTMAVTAMCDRYRMIVEQNIPRLRTNEWCLIFDAMNGAWGGGPAEAAITGVAANIADAILLDGADKRHGIEATEEFLERVQGWTLEQQLAVLDTAERFWCQDWKDAPDYDAVIARLLGSPPRHPALKCPECGCWYRRDRAAQVLCWTCNDEAIAMESLP